MELSSTPILQTPRLVLREVCESDWPQILHLRSDSQVNALVKRPDARTKEQAIEFIRKTQATGEFGRKLVYWGITLREFDEVLGSICLWKFSQDRKTAEVGYDLSVAAQGKGYMTEAMQAILDFGFDRLGLTKVEAYTQSNNAASIKLLQKFGFALLADRKDETNPLNAVYCLSKEAIC